MSFPPNFSWVCDGFLCALAFPEKTEHLTYLVNHGVTYLVSLTAESKPPTGQVKELDWRSIEIEDFTPPTLAQVQEFISVCEEARKKKTAIAVHCAAGKGRTGTMTACFLVKDLNLTAKDAIALIRELRPGSVETVEQEQMVAEFEMKLRKEENLVPINVFSRDSYVDSEKTA